MKNFVLIGAAGYIAPRHLKAIKETGNNLLAALDPHDSVGILDQYFPNAHFFTEFERFDRHCEKLKREGVKIDYVSVCSPNYLHDAHIRFGLRIGADVICEKPVVLNPWNVDALLEMEKETGKKIYSILQLRHHKEIINIREQIIREPLKKYTVNLNYITPRGNWYNYSWKGNEEKSGGILSNIGIHLFDILIYIFGPVKDYSILEFSKQSAKGILLFENASVNWLLSIDGSLLLKNQWSGTQVANRTMTIDSMEIDFSKLGPELHVDSYNEIINGNGFSLTESRKAIDLISLLKQTSK